MTFLKVLLFIVGISLLIGAGFYRTVKSYFRSDVFTDSEDECSTTNPERDHERRD